MRALLVVSVVVLAGCVPVYDFSLPDGWGSRTIDCSHVDGGTDAGPLACDQPSPIDPDAVTDLASFRAIASAALCDYGLRCDALAEQAYCHPRFAALAKAQNGVDPRAFDLGVARLCVRALARAPTCLAAFGAARSCGALETAGGWSAPHATVGAPCTNRCEFDLACVGRVCVVPSGRGGACAATVDCSVGLECRASACSLAPLGEICRFGLECEPGLRCVATSFSFFPDGICVTCDPDAPPHARHVGCSCATSDECPSGVALCSRGICVLRPFPGDACRGDVPCLESTCSAGTCR